MSRRKRVEVVEETPVEQASEEELVYCGPTLRYIAKQFTVYSGGIPEALETWIQAHPAAKILIVPLSQFAETRLKLNDPASAEAIIIKTLKSEI